jgi:hypothetical protein
MPKQETMRGLERGLRVLEAFEARPISSLHDLHLSTGIPKPSLLRVLQTLERFHLVSRRLGDAAIVPAPISAEHRGGRPVTTVLPKLPRRFSTACAKQSRGRPICWCPPAITC